MKTHYGKTHSLWMRLEDVPAYSSLQTDLSCDVCVIGSGIAGLTTSLLLAREGRSVILLEALSVCCGETSRTTAHLSFALDDRYYELERLFGEEGAKHAYESHARAIDTIEKIALDEKLDCEFTRLDGFLFAPAGSPAGELDQELAAAQRAGVPVERMEHLPYAGLDAGACLRFSGQAQFNPVRFASGLAQAFTRLGGKIYTSSRVTKITGGARPIVHTGQGFTVESEAVVVATNSPVNDNLTIHARQSPYRTYAIGATVPWDAVPRALYWDTLDPYHYVRLKSSETPKDREGTDILIVGGEDHRPGDSANENLHFKALEQWTRERFPIVDVAYRWSGLVLEPADSLAFIGRDNQAENVYIATGDSGHGITHGVIAGLLLTDLIAGRKNPWEHLYNPGRVTAQAAGEYVKDNAAVIANLTGWVTPGEVGDEADIAPGTGAVVRSGLSKLAVYRAKDGSLRKCSAVCTHLGCLVAWNSAERTWDCPCHGSRFNTHGQVLRGPATRDLDKVG